MAVLNEQKIVRPQLKYFLSPKAENLKLAPLTKLTRFGQITLLIVAARKVRASKGQQHFGLAGFYMS